MCSIGARELPLDQVLNIVDTVNQAPDFGRYAKKILVDVAANEENRHKAAIHAVSLLDCLMKNCPTFRKEMADPKELQRLYKTLPHTVRL
jgi:hypothetical protein